MTEKIEVLVEGGKATAAPPLGPALGPMKVNVQAVVDKINEKTKSLAGMKVPVTVIVNEKTRDFEIKVGTPPVSAMIKKELNLEKGSSETGEIRAGDLNEDQVRKLASQKFGSEDERFVNQIKGTARSMGITIGQGDLSEEELEASKKAHEDAKSAATAVPETGVAAAAAEQAEKAGEEPAGGEEPTGKTEEKPAGEAGKEKPRGEKGEKNQ